MRKDLKFWFRIRKKLLVLRNNFYFYFCSNILCLWFVTFDHDVNINNSTKISCVRVCIVVAPISVICTITTIPRNFIQIIEKKIWIERNEIFIELGNKFQIIIIGEQRKTYEFTFVSKNNYGYSYQIWWPDSFSFSLWFTNFSFGKKNYPKVRSICTTILFPAWHALIQKYKNEVYAGRYFCVYSNYCRLKRNIFIYNKLL